MKRPDHTRARAAMTTTMIHIVVALALACAFYSSSFAQTAGGTQISNTASATYGDGSGTTYNATSNTVTVTVSNVSGLTITPDVTNGSSDPTVVAGQTNVKYVFTVTNTGNFTDNVLFKAGSVQIASGPATIASAFIDVNGNGTYDAGTDTLINAADVTSAPLAQNASLSVVVLVNINAGAVAGNVIDVRLGDTSAGSPTFDNQPSDSSANEVRTTSASSVNGLREARGDRSSTVDNNAQLALSLTAPAGPLALGSGITYVWQLCNTGARAATAVTLTNAPAGSNTGVFIFAPVPAGVALAAQAFPAGTLFSTSVVASNPVTTAVWTTTQPGSPTMVAYNVGPSLASGACGANINMLTTITTSDATNPITNQGTAYALNSNSTQINTTSPLRTTTLQITGNVLNGPQGQPGAVNNTNNDDFTNKSVSTGLAGVAPGGVTTAAGTVTFTNTVQNTGNASDTYTLTVPTFPAGSTVKITVAGVQTTVINNGAATGNPVTPLVIAFGGTASYTVDITLPLGKTVLTGYDTVIRATSGNTNTSSNDTIDRVYTGFLQLTKTATVSNATGVGAATDPVPGAVITYSIVYKNIAATPAAGGSGNVTLTASNIVITENGSTGTNNWAATTNQVVGSASDPNGTLTGDTAGSTVLSDTIASLSAQQQGTFTFKRQIK